MIIGTYPTKDRLQEWFITELPSAQKQLKNFRILNELLEGFTGYEEKNYKDINNYIALLCLSRVHNSNNQSQLKLARLEKALETFNIRQWQKPKYKTFKKDLASNYEIKGFSTQTELEIALSITEHVGITNVTLFPELDNGKLSDICISLDNRQIYLEVCNLGKSDFEKIVEKIFDESANHLGQQVQKVSPNGCYIKIAIIIEQFPLDVNGRIEPSASAKKLNSEIDFLCLSNLVGYTGYYNIEDLGYLLADEKKYIEGRFSADPIVRKWLGSFDSKLLLKAKLVKSIITEQRNGPSIVQIWTQGAFSANKLYIEIDALVSAIIRKVKGKGVKNQRQPNVPNILAVMVDNIVMSAVQFECLKNKLQNILEQGAYGDLSGIAIFDGENDAWFLENSFAKQASVLSPSEILKLGFDLV